MTDNPENDVAIRNAFGAVNRKRLIDQYYAQPSLEPLVSSATAWMHVYRLLLWTDQTTGLAHCYESDKCQPGKNWYGRSLAFHDWLAQAFAVAPGKLSGELDWLFLKATNDLTAEVLRSAARTEALAAKQRAPYASKGLPKPGEDPELVAIIKDTLGGNLVGDVSPERWQVLVQRVKQYLAMENKRKNLVGEGFEDVLADVIRRSVKSNSIDVRVRSLLHDLPGFTRVRGNEKPNKVDVAIIRPAMRTIVTAKWSVRADREKQFAADFGDYVTAEGDGKPFEYVFVTNEFDPARLMRACEKLASNAYMFRHVVHINVDGLKATYQDNDATMGAVLKHIKDGRLISLGQWIASLDA